MLRWEGYCLCVTIELVPSVHTSVYKSLHHRVRRVATATFWLTFHHDGKVSPAWWGWGMDALPLLYTPTCTLCLYKAKLKIGKERNSCILLTPLPLWKISSLRYFTLLRPRQFQFYPESLGRVLRCISSQFYHGVWAPAQESMGSVVLYILYRKEGTGRSPVNK